MAPRRRRPISEVPANVQAVTGAEMQKQESVSVPDYLDRNIGSVDNENHRIVSWDEKEVPYDLLVEPDRSLVDALRDDLGLTGPPDPPPEPELLRPREELLQRNREL